MSGWSQSGRIVALGHDFGVRSQDSRIVDLVDWAYAELRAPGSPTGWYTIEALAPERYRVCWQDELVIDGVQPGKAVAWLQWDANRRATQRADGLIIHAAAARHEKGAVVIPGVSGAGKSTVVALLVRAGLDYLTDEAVLLPDSTAQVRPYPKPLALDPESVALLELADALPPELEGATDDKRLVPPQLLRAGCVAEACPPALVVFPSSGSAISVEALSPGEALLRLGQHAMNLPGHDGDGLERLASVARSAPAVRVVAPAAERAVEAVLGLLA